MTSKSKTLKKDVNYTLYKYSDIEKKRIIWEGNLNYRYDQIKIFSISQFAIYYVVLAKIPTEDDKQIMAIYLYRNLKQKPSYFFQLNEYERISVECPKSIKSKYFLFQLVGKDPNDIEIFGANNASERDEWIKNIGQALTWSKENLVSDGLPIVHPVRRSWKEDSQKNEDSDADVRSHYEPFTEISCMFSINIEFKSIVFSLNQSTINNGFHATEDRRSSLPMPSSIFIFPHRPAPPIPETKPSNSNEKSQIGMQRSHSLHTSQPTQHIYLSAKEIPPSSLIEEADEDEDTSEEFQSNPKTKTIDEDKNRSILLEDQLFTWNDIFYPNELDDHARVLNDIGQIGAFLIRPQLENNKLNDHKHTLSIYTFGGIIKYKILKLSNDEFSLVNDYSQPSFVSIPKLCQYYTNHSLPRSLLRDYSIKGPVGNICLKSPYTHYSLHTNKF